MGKKRIAIIFIVEYGERVKLPFPRDVFVELMQLTTSSVEFSFNNNMYRQIDGVAMGSPLGPALANIFVGHQEQKLFNVVNRPLAYFRYATLEKDGTNKAYRTTLTE